MKPVYNVSTPDYDKLGTAIDNAIREHFNGLKIAVRYLSLQDHASKTADDLIAIIQETGTDKYDPERKMSVAHDFYAEKGVDLFAVPAEVTESLGISTEALRDFGEGALQDRGYSLRIDLVVIYDRNKLEPISIQYNDGVGEDAFKFKDATNKANAVLGFIKLSS